MDELIKKVEAASRAERETRQACPTSDLSSPAYIEWRCDWLRKEQELRAARRKLGNAITAFCPVAMLDPSWHP